MDKASHWVKIFNSIINPTFRFVHIRPKVGLKQLSIFRVYHQTCPKPYMYPTSIAALVFLQYTMNTMYYYGSYIKDP